MLSNSAPSPQLRQFYENRYAQKTTGSITRSRVFRRAEHLRIEQEVLAPWLPSGEGLVVDVGTGAATYLADNRRVLATDLSYKALAQSSRHLKVSADATHLPLAARSVDGIICSQVLEHVPRWKDCIAECSRVLRPGGMLFVAVPNRYALMKRRYHALERKIDQSGHIHELREGQLRFALIEAGFTVAHTSGACYDVFWMLASLERSRWSALGCRLIDRLSAERIANLMSFEGRLRGHRLSGLSLQMVAIKDGT